MAAIKVWYESCTIAGEVSHMPLDRMGLQTLSYFGSFRLFYVWFYLHKMDIVRYLNNNNVKQPLRLYENQRL